MRMVEIAEFLSQSKKSYFSKTMRKLSSVGCSGKKLIRLLNSSAGSLKAEPTIQNRGNMLQKTSRNRKTTSATYPGVIRFFSR